MSGRVCLTLARAIPHWPAARRAQAVLIGDDSVKYVTGWSRVVTFTERAPDLSFTQNHAINCPCCVVVGSNVENIYQQTMLILRGAPDGAAEIIYVGRPSELDAVRAGVDRHLMLKARLFVNDLRFE